MVTNTEALEAVTRGPDGILAGLSAGKFFVDMTTGSPANSRALAADVDALGAKLLDAPISGAPTTVESGKASLMVTSRAPFVVDQPDGAWFDCNMMQKYMLLALDARRVYGVPMTTTAIT